MDKNTFIGLLLIGAIIIGFGILNGPSEEEIAQAKAQRDSIARLEEQKMEAEAAIEQATLSEKTAAAVADTSISDTASIPQKDSVERSMMKERYGVFAPLAKGETSDVILENELMRITLSNKGGRIKEVVLKDYQTYDSMPLVLMDEASEFNLQFFTIDNKNIRTDELYFEGAGEGFAISGEDEESFSMQLKVSEEQYLEYVYTLKGNSYMIDFDVNLIGMDQVLEPRQEEMFLNWSVNAPNQEKSLDKQRNATTVFYKYRDESVDEISATSDDKEEFETSVKWVSFKQEFFNTTLISDDYFDKTGSYAETKTDEDQTAYVKEMSSSLAIPVANDRIEKIGMSFYLGPNKYSILNNLENDLDEIIPLGWGIFGWVNKIAVIPVFNFLDGFDLSYGIVILILTVLLKLVLFPITYKTYSSGAKMRVLKPEINEINEKHKDDAVKKQQAMMELYRSTGVNPLSGCIPLLIQMPILFAMFRFFPASIELRQESFLWAEDLSTYDAIYTWTTDIPLISSFYGNHISLFTLLMAASIMSYTRFNSQMSMGAAEGPMAQQMKVMMYIMPFMMLFFFNSYAAGLSYYYFLANIISIGQTLFIRKVLINETAIRAKIEQNKKRPKSKKKSSFQKRMEEVAKQRGYQQPKRK